MRKANLTYRRCGRDLRSGDERWRPLAQHLAARFAATEGYDEKMVQAAVAVFLDAERRLGSRRPDFFSLVVPLAIRALRRYRHERIRSRPESIRPLPALQLAIVTAENELSRRLRRSPTVAEIATHLEVAQHQVVAGLEAGWSAGPGATGTR